MEEESFTQMSLDHYLHFQYKSLVIKWEEPLLQELSLCQAKLHLLQ